MNFDFSTLETLRRTHPAWKLLLADNAPLIASFIHRTFLVPNVRTISQSALVESLEDELYALRQQLGPEAFPRRAQDYLNDWVSSEKGWLRKFYPASSDEPHFDLTPSTEKTLSWLESLTTRPFVGTESRLLTIFELLRQIVRGAEVDPIVRTAELRRRRAEIDAEIASVERGDIQLMDDTAVRERFQQFLQMAKELLSDFREVDQNFRLLDRQIRERVTLWEGGKGELLDEILGKRNAIADSDQGRSFHAFWDFLMSQSRQEELSSLLARTLQLKPVAGMQPDRRVNRVHHDWLDAGENTQRTVAQLSQQLRRFIDDRAYLENRRIISILRSIEAQAVHLRDNPPSGPFADINEAQSAIDLPMDRPLFTPGVKAFITSSAVENADSDVDMAALFSQFVIDKNKLRSQIRQALQERSNITLRDLVQQFPVEQGLAELVAYLEIATEAPIAVFDDDGLERIYWQDRAGEWKCADMQRVTFVR
jgi:hypothetical protein